MGLTRLCCSRGMAPLDWELGGGVNWTSISDAAGVEGASSSSVPVQAIQLRRVKWIEIPSGQEVKPALHTLLHCTAIVFR